MWAGMAGWTGWSGRECQMPPLARQQGRFSDHSTAGKLVNPSEDEVATEESQARNADHDP